MTFPTACALLLLAILPLVTRTGAQSAAAAPSITTVTVSGCPTVTGVASCGLPFTVSVQGSNLNALSQVLNISDTICFPSLVTGAFALAAAAGSLVCALPNRYTPLTVGYNAPVPVSVVDLSTQLTSNVVSSFTVTPVPPIVLSSISGCVGSGAATNGCDLQRAVITISGSGFQLDQLPWYLLFSTSNSLYTDQPGFLIPTAYTITSTAITIPLNYTLTAGSGYAWSPAPSPTGNMSLCFTHGNTVSNCLALSYFYAPNAPAPPTPAPTAGLVTSAAMSISSITGCPVSVNGTTSGCVAGGFFLTIVGSNFPSTAGLLVAVGQERCVGPSGPSTRIMCYIPDEVTAVQVGVWLPVTIIDTLQQQQSAPYYGVQFTQPGLITIASVTGCAGDGAASTALTTSQCNLVSDTLTLTGSGFVVDSPARQWLALLAVPASSATNVRLSLSAAWILNSTSMQIPASSLFASLLASAASPNLTTTLCLVHGNQLSTNCASVSATTPRPVVTSISGCAPSLNGTISECTPGVSTLTVTGSWFLSPVTVTVAGEVCALLTSTQTFITCALPVVVGLVPNTYYDVVVSNFLSSVTLPASVAFTAHPTINSLTSQFCPPDFAARTAIPLALYCGPGDVLTIVGSFFSDLSSLAVQISSPSTYGAPAVQLTCGSLQFQSTNVLTCVLPTPPADWQQYGSSLNVVVWENSTYSSNVVQAALYYGAADPHVSAVQGCAQSDTNTAGVAGCQVGDAVTLVGSNFAASLAGSSPTQVQLYNQGDLFTCATPRVLSASALTCVLPYTIGVAVDSVLPIRIYNMNGRQSNWLVAINYQSLSIAAATSDTRFVVAVSVLVPIVVLLLVVMAVMCWRQSGLNAKLGSGGMSWRRQRDAGDSNLQMSDVQPVPFDADADVE